MNPLLLHLDRFSARALQQKYFTRGKTIISLFIGERGYFYIAFPEEVQKLYSFCLIWWVLGLKINVIIHLIVLGIQGRAKKKKKGATVGMALLQQHVRHFIHKRWNLLGAELMLGSRCLGRQQVLCGLRGVLASSPLQSVHESQRSLFLSCPPQKHMM